MKNKIKIFGIIFSLTALILSSCEKNVSSEGLSRLTYYPEFIVNGESIEFIELGEAWADPGVVATENDEEIPVVVSVVGDYFNSSGESVNTDIADKHIVTYTATNSDGFDGTAERIVYVYKNGDLVSSIEGLYLSQVCRMGNCSGQYTDLEYVMIRSTGGNTYEINCAVGTYYSVGRSYGSGYSAQGSVITANDIAANDFTITGATFPIWGNTVVITDFTVDAANKEISFTGTANIGNGTFYVYLKQVN